MKYRQLDNIPGNKKASCLTYGTGSDIIMGDDREAAAEVLDMAWEHGFTIFDSANAYGNAEKNVGYWMQKRGNREDIILFDKGCNPGMNGSEDQMTQELIHQHIETSCDRLQTAYLDCYVLHRDDPSYPVERIIDALQEEKEKGVIGTYGVSNWTLDRIQKANAYAKSQNIAGISVVSPAYSLAELIGDPWGGSVALSGKAHERDRAWFFEQKIPVFSYSSLARGYLSGKYRTDGEKPIEECLWWAPIEEYDAPVNRERLHRAEQLAAEKGVSVSQICLAWLLSQPLQVVPIVCPGKEKHMKDNIQALDVQLTEEETVWLLEGRK